MDSSPANDALLVQLVGGALGRSGRGTSGINVNSCSSVVTVHGSVSSVEERDGVEAVTNKLRVISRRWHPGCFRRYHSGYLGVSRKTLRQDGGK